ncbi:MAG: hypothetical protein FJ215_13280 [Ignavibacteria bacterium]|nr:hypothetical protein [Ignavibacteria bacterium]
MHCRELSAVALLVVLTSVQSAGQTSFFTSSTKIGSESLYNPISLLLNGGFDIIQFPECSRKVFSFPYHHAARNVARNLADPFSTIDRYGWKAFLKNEVLPFNFALDQRQWWPNYHLHLIGGGMTYAKMTEWYDAHGFPFPHGFSLVTMAGYHFLNEGVENGTFVGDNVDPIADIYIFDVAGIVLFSFDNVKEFFATELNLADWSLQPSIAIRDGSLLNNGQFFSIKWRPPGFERWSLFYYFGLDGLTGASYRFGDGNSLSAGIGMSSRQRRVVDPVTNRQTVDLVWSFGIFLDGEKSLLASVVVAKKMHEFARINIYPGLLPLGPLLPGLWLSSTDSEVLTFGLTARYVPGIAIR